MRTFKKIDIYVKKQDGLFHYFATTSQSITLRDAKVKFLTSYNFDSKNVKLSYA